MSKKPNPETLELRAKTDQELLEARQRLAREFQKHSATATQISRSLGRIKNELARRRTENNKPFVSDHAILRYLKRVKVVDVEAIRHEIAIKTPEDIKERTEKEFEENGFKYMLSKDGKCITTVIKPGENDEEETSNS